MNPKFPIDPEALIKNCNLEYKFKDLVNLNLKFHDHIKYVFGKF